MQATLPLQQPTSTKGVTTSTPSSSSISSSDVAHSNDSSTVMANLIKTVLDKSDVLELAKKNHPGFKIVSKDEVSGVLLETMPVPYNAIVMVKASAPMECRAEEFLRYLDDEIRCKWDEHFRMGKIIKNVEVSLTASSSFSSSSSHQPLPSSTSSISASPPVVSFKHLMFNSPVGPVMRHRDFEVAVSEEITPDGIAVLKAVSTPIGFLVPPPTASSSSTVATAAASVKGLTSLLFRPKQTSKSANSNNNPSSSTSSSPPVAPSSSPPSSEAAPDGKLFVRGLIKLSGFVARPLTPAPPGAAHHHKGIYKNSHPHKKEEERNQHQQSKSSSSSSSTDSSSDWCEVTYIAVIDPMGTVPAPLVNALISKQTAGIIALQKFIHEDRVQGTSAQKTKKLVSKL